MLAIEQTFFSQGSYRSYSIVNNKYTLGIYNLSKTSTVYRVCLNESHEERLLKGTVQENYAVFFKKGSIYIHYEK